MASQKALIQALEKIAYDPYDRIEHPTAGDWLKSYDALKELCELVPEEGVYPNTLGYLCYYGRHTGGMRKYEEARAWFEPGTKLGSIESSYKLADMLMSGLGGPEDPDRALRLYLRCYLYCRDQFEQGYKESKFADAALRMGRLYHDGKALKKDDMEALGYLLEAKYAIDWRKAYDHYGDDTVEKNILCLMDECDKPSEEMQGAALHGIGIGRVPHYLLLDDDVRMTIDIDVSLDGFVRLEFRRKRKDGKKPNRILWSVPPAMKVYMTDSVVLYGRDIREIWNREPGKTVVCDRFEYDGDKQDYLFYLGDELQCRLQGGEYVLPMDEFWMTQIRDHPEAGSEIVQ